MTIHLPARLARLGAVAGGAAATLALTAGVAGAHVTIGDEDQVAGAYTVLTVSVPHGCEESPTTRIRIQMPEQIPTVTPTVNPNWDVEVKSEALAEPVDIGHGQTVSERDSEVVYTARTPLPHDLRDTMELSLKIPEGAAGETLFFPIIQECTDGESAWIERPAAGQEGEELAKPAPFIVVSEPSSGPGHSGSTTGTTQATATAETVVASSTSASAPAESSSNGLAIAGIVLGGLGIVLGGTALATRKR
jgi:uncharacterized protein YcnI